MESVHSKLIRMLSVAVASTKQLSKVDICPWSISCWEDCLKQGPLRAHCKNNSILWSSSYYWGLRVLLSLNKWKKSVAMFPKQISLFSINEWRHLERTQNIIKWEKFVQGVLVFEVNVFFFVAYARKLVFGAICKARMAMKLSCLKGFIRKYFVLQ